MRPTAQAGSPLGLPLPPCTCKKDLVRPGPASPAGLPAGRWAILWKAVLVSIFFIPAGCSRLPPPDPLMPAASSQDLCRSVRSKCEEISTHVTDARITLKSEGGSARFRQVSMMMRPASLRFEIIDPFGRALFLIVSDGDRLTAFDIMEGSCALGPAGPDTLSRFLPVSIAAEELIDLLAGAPAPDCEDLEEERAEHGLRRLRAGRRDRAGHQVLSIDPSDHMCRTVELYDTRGKLELRGEFSEFERADGFTLPRRIRLSGPEAGGGDRADFEMNIKYGELTVNGPVDSALFSFTPPPWATIVDIDESGVEGLFP